MAEGRSEGKGLKAECGRKEWKAHGREGGREEWKAPAREREGWRSGACEVVGGMGEEG